MTDFLWQRRRRPDVRLGCLRRNQLATRDELLVGGCITTLRRYELTDGSAAVGHGERLACRHSAQVLARVLAQLADTDAFQVLHNSTLASA